MRMFMPWRDMWAGRGRRTPGGIEAVLAVVLEKLAAEIAFVGGEAVVGAVEGGEVEAPSTWSPLDGVGQALEIDDELVELQAVGVDVVGLWAVAVRRGAEVERGLEPAIELGAAARTVRWRSSAGRCWCPVRR